MNGTEGLTYRDFDFDPEAVVLQWVGAAIGLRGQGDKAEKAVILYVDTTQRKDVQALIKAHEEKGEGEVNSVWMNWPPGDGGLAALLEFTVPTKATIILPFILLKHGVIADNIISGARLHLVPVEPDEDFRTINSDRSNLVVEVFSEGIQNHWPAVWISAVEKELEIDRDSAERIVEQLRVAVDFKLHVPGAPDSENIAEFHLDEESKTAFFATKDMLLNQFKRDGPNVSASFDGMFDFWINDLSEEFGIVNGQLIPAILAAQRSGDTLEMRCAQLIGNALFTTSAALELARLGYRLQPGALLRTALEAISIAAYLRMNPSDLAKVMAGKLRAENTIGNSNTVYEGFGRLYGHLSQDFAHAGTLYHYVEPPAEYKNRQDPKALTNLVGAYTVLLLIGMFAEFVFYERIHRLRYWRKLETGQLKLEIVPEVVEKLNSLREKLSAIQDEAK